VDDSRKNRKPHRKDGNGSESSTVKEGKRKDFHEGTGNGKDFQAPAEVLKKTFFPNLC